MCNAPLYEKRRGLKLRRYAARLIDLNEYLEYFPGSTMADKIDITKLNENLSNSMHNRLSKQAYVQGFYGEFILFKIREYV